MMGNPLSSQSVSLNNMKRYKSGLSYLVAAVLLLSCEGPVGPAGPAGADGQDGIPGMTVQLVDLRSTRFPFVENLPGTRTRMARIDVPSLTLAVLGAGSVSVQFKDGFPLPHLEHIGEEVLKHDYKLDAGILEYWLIPSSGLADHLVGPAADTLRIVTINPLVR